MTSPAKPSAPAAGDVADVPAPYRQRTMTMADYAAVLDLWRATEGVGLNEADTPAGIALFLERNPGLSVVVTLPDDTLVAAVLCGHDGRRGYLHHLAVAPAHRRRGVARAVVTGCLERLRALGILKCNLFLYAHNTAGREFWLRQGWSARDDLVVVQRETGRTARGN